LLFYIFGRNFIFFLYILKEFTKKKLKEGRRMSQEQLSSEPSMNSPLRNDNEKSELEFKMESVVTQSPIQQQLEQKDEEDNVCTPNKSTLIINSTPIIGNGEKDEKKPRVNFHSIDDIVYGSCTQTKKEYSINDSGYTTPNVSCNQSFLPSSSDSSESKENYDSSLKVNNFLKKN
jgi:hypothetical protein